MGLGNSPLVLGLGNGAIESGIESGNAGVTSLSASAAGHLVAPVEGRNTAAGSGPREWSNRDQTTVTASAVKTLSKEIPELNGADDARDAYGDMLAVMLHPELTVHNATNDDSPGNQTLKQSSGKEHEGKE